MSKSTIARYVGVSHDQRTNRWSITCPACGKVFKPETTMRSTQNIQCTVAKCKAEMIARYNEEPPTVTLLKEEA